MRPPICEVCHWDGRDQAGDFGLVQFSDYRPLPDGITGHPEGMGWFCNRHLAAARARRNMTLAEAVDEIMQG